MSSVQALTSRKKDDYFPLRSMLIQGRTPYFYGGQGGLVRFSCLSESTYFLKEIVFSRKRL